MLLSVQGIISHHPASQRATSDILQPAHAQEEHAAATELDRALQMVFRKTHSAEQAGDAPGHMLSENFQTLPPMSLDDASMPGDSTEEMSAAPVASMLKGLQLKSRNLTNASAPDLTFSSSQARYRLRAALTPEAIPNAESRMAAEPWRELMKEIAGPPVLCSTGLQPRPEKLPAAVQKHLSNKGGGNGTSIKSKCSRESGGREAGQDEASTALIAGARLLWEANGDVATSKADTAGGVRENGTRQSRSDLGYDIEDEEQHPDSLCMPVSIDANDVPFLALLS